MRKFLQETEYVIHEVSIVCDICNKEFSYLEKADILEIQEFYQINFTGGYDSVFGDGTIVQCDVCQHCLLKMIQGKYREIEK
jgi:hypothetical protein